LESEQREEQERINKALKSIVTEIQRDHVKLKKSLARIEEDQGQLREMIGQVKQLQEELRETMFGVHQDHTHAAAGVLELQRYCVRVDDRLHRLEESQENIKVSVAALSPPDPDQDPQPPKWKFWA